MALNITLPSGVVAIYGIGAQASSPQSATPQGIVLDASYRYGTIYNIWDGGATYVYGGDIVFWEEGKQYCRVVTEENLTYTLVKFNNITKEPAVIVIPPP